MSQGKSMLLQRVWVCVQLHRVSRQPGLATKNVWQRSSRFTMPCSSTFVSNRNESGGRNNNGYRKQTGGAFNVLFHQKQDRIFFRLHVSLALGHNCAGARNTERIPRGSEVSR